MWLENILTSVHSQLQMPAPHLLPACFWNHCVVFLLCGFTFQDWLFLALLGIELRASCMLNECFTVESYLPRDLRMLLRNLTWHYGSCGKMHPSKQSCKMQTVLPRIWPCMQGKGDKKWSLGGWWRLEAMSSDEDVQHMEMPPLKDPHFPL